MVSVQDWTGSCTGLETGPCTGLETGPCTGLETGPCTGLETGPCTGLETGPCTGLETGSCTGLETGSRTVMVAVIIKTSRVQDPLVTSQHSTMLDNTKPNVPQHVLYYTIIHYLVQWVSKLL